MNNTTKNDITNDNITNEQSSAASNGALSLVENLAGQRVSRRGLLGIAGQGVLGLAALALFQSSGSPAAAFAGGRTKLERMMPGARELKRTLAGQPMTGRSSFSDTPPIPVLPLIPSLPMWGDGQNFDRPEYYETLCVGDVNGDGQDELIIRGPAGILIEQFDTRIGQWVTLTSAGPALGDAAGWNQPQYYQTIQCLDVDGDGKAEIVLRGPDGLVAYNYDTSTRKFTALPTGPFFKDADDNGIWTQQAHYSTIKWGDVKGNGLNFVVARNPQGIVTLYYAAEEENWFAPYFGYGPWPDTDPLDGTNWTLPQYYETIRLADIDGDGQEELLGRSSSGLQVWKFDKTASNWKAMYTGGGRILSDGEGWGNDASYYSTIQCADIDGDGVKEVLGRGGDGIHAYKWNPSSQSFNELPMLLDFLDYSPWEPLFPEYYTTIMCGDIDGDGADEVIGRSGDGNGVQTWKYFPTGPFANSWEKLQANQPAWTDDGTDGNGHPMPDANGTAWDEVQYYSTLRFARTLPDLSNQYFPNLRTAPTHDGTGGPRSGPYATLIARDQYGIQTWRYQQRTNNREDGGFFARTSTPMPDFTSSETDQNLVAAYKALDTLIRGVGASGNIRDTYNDQTADFSTWTAGMYDMPLGTTYYGPYIAPKAATPAGVDATAWQKVTWQIYWEMAYVIKVNDWFFTKMTDLITQSTLNDTLNVQTVGALMGIPQTSNSSVIFSILAMVANFGWAVLGFPELAGAEEKLPGQLSALSGCLGTAFGSSTFESGDTGGTWQGKYAEMNTTLVNTFTQARLFNTALNTAITGGANNVTTGYRPGDFGLLAAIGQQILEAATNSPWVWPTDLGDIVTLAQHGFALQLFQSIIPVSSWFVMYTKPGYPPAGIPYEYVTGSSDEDHMWLATNIDKVDSFPPTFSQDQVFKTPTNSWDIWPLGVPLSDVFEGHNGWPKLPKKNFQSFSAVPEPTPLAKASPDLQTKVTLKRNADTGMIEAELTIENDGLVAATNMEIRSATLSSRAAIEPLPHERTRLAWGKKWTTTVKFPADTAQAGQTVVLRLQGRHKTGTFGGSFRVKMP
jgi:hypothetical protein